MPSLDLRAHGWRLVCMIQRLSDMGYDCYTILRTDLLYFPLREAKQSVSQNPANTVMGMSTPASSRSLSRSQCSLFCHGAARARRARPLPVPPNVASCSPAPRRPSTGRGRGAGGHGSVSRVSVKDPDDTQLFLCRRHGIVSS